MTQTYTNQFDNFKPVSKTIWHKIFKGIVIGGAIANERNGQPLTAAQELYLSNHIKKIQ